MPPLGKQIDELARTIKVNVRNPSLSFWSDTKEVSQTVLADAIKSGTENEANSAWFLDANSDVRLRFVGCFEKITKEEYYTAWCELERIEIKLNSLRRNAFYCLEDFDLGALANLVKNWQSLYPYHVFFSPGYVIKERKCSICGSTGGARFACGHQKGNVYSGRECFGIISKAEILEISLVVDPVQKYSVAFTSDSKGNKIDQYDYSIVRFVAQRICAPFDVWDAEWTEAYHPHEMLSDRSLDGDCPCGSGRRYQECCSKKPGVVRPHLSIVFERAPPADLPNASFAGYGEKNGPAVLTGTQRG
jgi:hypothetical protein